ncbi:MAG: type II toxin-antitoxin system prevent-host-death family antitoxin [Gammaproteobacteria bacterium]|nr:type II toxin-antitoxin system prevent-host-death family antitoxin [Gammaproteobacteria bacterium]
MKTSLRGLRDHLHDYVLRAKEGEEVVITLNNHPVARLMPLENENEQRLLCSEQFLSELEILQEALSVDVKADKPA